MTKQEHGQNYPRASALREIKLTCGTSARVLSLNGGGLSIMITQPRSRNEQPFYGAASKSDIVLLGTEDMELLNKAIQEARKEADATTPAIC